MAIPKRTAARIKSGLKKFKRILDSARSADRSEQDTVTIITDMLAEVFGYDKYDEITGEYAIRGTYCDLAVKVNGKVKYLIEVKAIDKCLKDNHLRQATDYAAKEGIEWVVLTNGVEWQAHRMVFEQPVRYDHVFTIDLLQGGSELVEMVYMLSREGIVKQAISEYHEQRQALDRYVISAVLLSPSVLNVVRRELRRVSGGVKVDATDVRDVLTSEVLKRDVVESKMLKDAVSRIRRSPGRRLADRKSTQATAPPETESTETLVTAHVSPSQPLPPGPPAAGR